MKMTCVLAGMILDRLTSSLLLKNGLFPIRRCVLGYQNVSGTESRLFREDLK